MIAIVGTQRQQYALAYCRLCWNPMTHRFAYVFFLVLSLVAFAARAGTASYQERQYVGLTQPQALASEGDLKQRKAALRASLQAERQESGNVKQRQLSPQDRADLRQQLRLQHNDGERQ